jgi:hypothetical protein
MANKQTDPAPGIPPGQPVDAGRPFIWDRPLSIGPDRLPGSTVSVPSSDSAQEKE